MAKRNKRNWKHKKYVEDQHVLHSYRNTYADDATRDDIATLFDKKYEYTRTDEWPSPTTENLFSSMHVFVLIIC